LWLNQTALTSTSKMTTAATVALLFGTLPVVAVATGARQLAHQNWHVAALAWAAVAYGALTSVGLSNLLWFKAIRHVGPGRAAL
jgi:drug/metabolite transporter (DMT)-like permease